ncbi:MAG: hypothetical protein HY074_04200 [Deltaproteobacteria bacterium]|nr:hypothetical protein [Deltaproteobacteria bacterium]
MSTGRRKPKGTGFGRPGDKASEKTDEKSPKGAFNGIKTAAEKQKDKKATDGLDFRDFEMKDDPKAEKDQPREEPENGLKKNSSKSHDKDAPTQPDKPPPKPRLGMGIKPKEEDAEGKKNKLGELAGLAMDFKDENAGYGKTGLNDKEEALGGKDEAKTEHINSEKAWKGHNLSPEELKRKGKEKKEDEGGEGQAGGRKKKPKGFGSDAGDAESDGDEDDDSLGDESRNFLKKKRGKDAVGEKFDSDDDPSGGRSLGSSGPDKGRKMNAHDSDQEKEDTGEDQLVEMDSVTARMKVKEGAEEVKFEYPFDHFGVSTGTWESTGSADKGGDGTKIFVFVDPALRTDKNKTVDSIKVWWIYRGEARPMFVIVGKKWVCRKTEAKKIEGFSNLSAGTQAYLLSISPAASMKRKAEAAEKLKAEVDEKKKAKDEVARKRAEEATQIAEKTATEKKKKHEESFDALNLRRKRAVEENASSAEASAEKKKARNDEENAAADAALEQKIRKKQVQGEAAAAEEETKKKLEQETLDLASGTKTRKQDGESKDRPEEAETEEEKKKKREKGLVDGIDFSGSGMIESEKMNADSVDPFSDAETGVPSELESLLDKAIEQAPIAVIPVRLPSSPMVAVVLSEMLMFCDGRIAEAMTRYFTFLSGCFGGAKLALFSVNGRVGRCISSNHEGFPLEHEEDFSKTMLAKDAIDKRTAVEHPKTAGTIFCAVTSPPVRGIAAATIGLLVIEPLPPAKSMAGNVRYLHGVAQCLRGPVDYLGRDAWNKPRKKAAA